MTSDEHDVSVEGQEPTAIPTPLASGTTANPSVEGQETPTISRPSREATASIYNVPETSVRNAFLHFFLEVAALFGIGHFGYSIVESRVVWAAPLMGVLMALATAVVYLLHNVPQDPLSRSGNNAAIPVSGKIRLGIEVSIFGFAGFAIGVGSAMLGIIFGMLGVLHYVSYRERIYWLWNRK